MEKLCRLCLNVANPAKILTKNMLQTLSINVELSVHSAEPVICETCESILKKCFDFIRLCQSSKQISQPLGFADEGIKRENESRSCLFCKSVVNEDQCYSLQQLEEEMVASQEFISDCILQLYAAASEQPVACESCYECLNTYMSFSKTCLVSDSKIKSSLDESLENVKSRVRRVYDISSSSDAGQKPYGEIILKKEEEISLKEEDSTKEILHAQLKLEDELEIVDPTTLSSALQQVFTCTSCPFTTTKRCYLRRHVAKRHADVIPLYRCDRCDFKTINKWYLPVHALCHSDPNVDKHKCPKCDYETINPINMKLHLVKHDDSVRFSCEKCPFTTKYSACLRRHEFVHRPNSEMETHKCEMCPYESKFAKYLKMHMLQHKREDEVTMYGCDKCSYKTKRKSNLASHQLIHKDKKDLRIFKCELCSYESKRRTELRQHMVCHQTRSEGRSFDCPLCKYWTKRKTNLKQHMRFHKDKTVGAESSLKTSSVQKSEAECSKVEEV